MAEPGQIVKEEVMPEGIPTLENASLYVKLEEIRNTKTPSDMLETMRSLKA